MYAYCLNNPINSVDQEGEIGIFACIIIGMVVGAIIGGTTAAVISNNKIGKVQPKSVVTGAVIGGVVGGAIGGRS